MKVDWYTMSDEQLYERLDAVLDQINLRNLPETEELQLEVGTTRRNGEYEPVRVCVLGDDQHCQEARALGEHYLDVDDMKDLHKDQTRVGSLARGYDVFFVTDTLMAELPKLLPGFVKRKLPEPVSHEQSLEEKIRDTKEFIQDMQKKVLRWEIHIGNVSMSTEQLVPTIRPSVRTVMGIMPPDWRNIVTMHVKLNDMTRYSLL